ncbi:MAG: RsmD family RNA methyltransferase [Planctomycetota bacterium]
MRVLAGSARSVPLKTVPDFQTRPILDRLKKSLFSILETSGLILDATVADLYAGTGTQGIEALSRGAEKCWFVERRTEAIALLKENLTRTHLEDRAIVRCQEVGPFLAGFVKESGVQTLFDLVLYDPPFSFSREAASRSAAEAEMSLASKLLYPGHARLVLRFEKSAAPPAPQGLELVRHWTDGPHAFAFYKREA